jgi:hypothetical protein
VLMALAALDAQVADGVDGVNSFGHRCC